MLRQSQAQAVTDVTLRTKPRAEKGEALSSFAKHLEREPMRMVVMHNYDRGRQI